MLLVLSCDALTVLLVADVAPCASCMPCYISVCPVIDRMWQQAPTMGRCVPLSRVAASPLCTELWTSQILLPSLMGLALMRSTTPPRSLILVRP